MRASRRVNRFERFQLARFARCVQTGDPYIYHIDADSIQRAASQGISTNHIQTFIARHLEGNPLPLPIVKLLRNWQDGAKTSVAFETVIVLTHHIRRDTGKDLRDARFSPLSRSPLGTNRLCRA